MSEHVADFDAYCALGPVQRMQARLEGLAEVLCASGLKILPGEPVNEAAQGAGFSAATQQQQAFNETGTGFDSQHAVSGAARVSGTSKGPLNANADQGSWQVTSFDIKRLSEDLDLPPERILAALKNMSGS